MSLITHEKLLARVLALGSAFTTIFIVSGSVTDPVNVTKLLSLGIAASLCLGLLLSSNLLSAVREFKLLFLFSGLFLATGLASVFLSNSPFSQGMYGTYGRNNGWLLYFFLVVTLITASLLQSSESIHLIIRGLLFAGVVNVIYCIWVISFGDFIGWNNPYGNILGTLGNPNFIGAFLGIFIAAYFAYGLGGTSSKLFKYSMFLVIPLTAFEIYDSSAIQGRIVGASGFALVGFFYLRSKFNWIVTGIYTFFVGAVGVLALLGALQIGPLTSLIYKYSVSLRGQYWLAAWNAGKDNLVHGVGMDAFGDWYRRSRDEHALEVPGVNTVVNAAHNVPLDMFAFGGWPLLVSYLAIMAIGACALIRTFLRSKSYDPILVVLVTSWTGYQLQSLISINQIGLAIWGWVVTGAAIAYEKISRIEPSKSTNEQVNGKKNRANQELRATTFPIILASGLIGLLLAVPPFAADSNWRKAQTLQTLAALEGSMVNSYFNIPNTMKYLTNIQTLEQSKFYDLSRKYALIAVEWNPESFELWRLLYYIKNSSPEEKALALATMRKLDPFNPELSSLK
jgi:hypothetical protein